MMGADVVGAVRKNLVTSMSRPRPTVAVHFTHVSHLATIVERGLLADSVAQAEGLLSVEVGNVGIKDARRRRPVPIPPGGVVADYVPFYLAPRSPMMFAIHKGNVPTYTGGCDDLVYLVTTVENLVAGGAPVLFTDRNAVLAVAAFFGDVEHADGAIDWPLMRDQYWSNTAEDPDRVERRMAECLVHRRVPWQAFTELVTKDQRCATTARAVLGNLSVDTPVTVRPAWYF